MAKKQSTTINFEESLKELETLVARMEKGELTLEDSLKYFERGIELTRKCQEALKTAEQKVQMLTDKQLTSLDLTDDESGDD